LKKIARLLFELNPEIPFTILASSRISDETLQKPKAADIVEAYNEVRAVGLRNVRLGNTGVFASTEEDHLLLKQRVGIGNY